MAMRARPAGESSDEDDDLFFDDKFKEQRKEQNRIAYERFAKEEAVSYASFAFAVVSGNLESVRSFLDTNHLDVNAPIRNGKNALYLAVCSTQVVIVDELLARGADVNASLDGVTALMAACEQTCEESVLPVITSLVQNGAKVTATDRKHRTAFMLACAQGIRDVVLYLRPHSDLEAQDIQGWTSLFYAVHATKPRIVELLLKENVNYRHVDIKQKDVSYYAKQLNCIDTMRLLPQCQTEVLRYDMQKASASQRDVFRLLEAMRCPRLYNVFASSCIDLKTFLTLDAAQLKLLGVNTARQRRNILKGLHDFHAIPWTKTSLHIFTKETIFTTAHVRQIIDDVRRHLVIMEGTVHYVHNHRRTPKSTNKLLYLHMRDAVHKIESIVQILTLLVQQAKQHDCAVADLIGKDMPKPVPLNQHLAVAYSRFLGLCASFWY